MTNLAISNLCNQDCPYCFTQDQRSDLPAKPFLDLELFNLRLDYLDRSGVDQVRLIGGEPTLHPRFDQLVTLARARGKSIAVFSNGLMPAQALDCLTALAPTECTVVVNVNTPASVGELAHQRRCNTVRRLGKRALLGFNIYRTDLQLEFLLSIITETACQPRIRLGLAHPCLSGTNQYIRPQHYPFIGAKITRFAIEAAKHGISVEFDCGFVRCMFSDEDLKTLQELHANVGWHCNPILDVGIDDWVIHCYPLSRLLRLPLTPATNAVTLRQVFVVRAQVYRESGIYKECWACPFKSTGECSGGCLATTIRRFQLGSVQLRVPRNETQFTPVNPA